VCGGGGGVWGVSAQNRVTAVKMGRWDCLSALLAAFLLNAAALYRKEVQQQGYTMAERLSNSPLISRY
jgi:hypothetical protein